MNSDLVNRLISIGLNSGPADQRQGLSAIPRFSAPEAAPSAARGSAAPTTSSIHSRNFSSLLFLRPFRRYVPLDFDDTRRRYWKRPTNRKHPTTKRRRRRRRRSPLSFPSAWTRRSVATWRPFSATPIRCKVRFWFRFLFHSVRSDFCCFDCFRTH